MFIAMNRSRVVEGTGEQFEKRWRSRESYLQDVPGFVHFALLRSDTAVDYISHSTCASRAAFDDWTRSEAFAAGHRQGSIQGLLAGPPAVSLYEVVLAQEASTVAQS